MATDPRYTKSAREGGIPRPQTFGEAFREAKDAGEPDFEFPPRSGKMYSTKTAEEQGREIGARAATGSGRGASAGRTAAHRDTATTRRAEIPTGGSAKAPAERGERMSPLEMGLLTTAGALAGPALGRGAATAYRGAKDVVDTVRGAVQASRGLEDARRARLAREMDDSLPEPASIPELGRGVFRSAREKAEAEARNAKPRVRVEGTKGGVYRSEAPKTESKAGPEFRSRTADRMDEREMGMKKGGKVKAYAKGGSVRGGGCETRTKKTKYV